MKRFITIIILGLLLCSCSTPTRDVGERTQQSSSASNSAAAVSESPLITESPAATGSPVPTKSAVHPEKVTPGVVVDETGKKHKLKLGKVNLNNAEMTFPLMTYPTNYSQVVKNHYYFLRADGRRNYTIYQDKGEIAGKFSLKRGLVTWFVFYQNKFYAIVAKNNSEERGEKLVEIDLRRQSIKDVCYTDLGKGKRTNVSFDKMYKGIFLCYDKKKRIGAFNLNKRKVIANFLVPPKEMPYIGYWLDGKIYDYKIISDKKIVIYSFDLKSCKTEKILEFECKGKQDMENVEYMHGLEIDEDYIYCMDYLIPNKGGKIIRLPHRVIRDRDREWLFSFTQASIFTYNKKYIFYIDGEGKIHRIDKKTREDVVISDQNKIHPMDIQCTEDGLYIQEFYYGVSMDYLWENPDTYLDTVGVDTEEDDSCDLYYMDCNGENIKQIW